MSSNHHESRKTSQGHNLSDAIQLDGHYLLAQTQYEASLKAVGLQPGWHVLDAGCGVGSFLPLMSQLVGPNGRISAVDLAPENVEAAQARAAAGQVICPFEGRVSTITELPYDDDTFDAVWCANVMQYLNDEQLAATLLEFRRVVKPGGLVAIKEFDFAIWHFWPPGPGLMWRYLEALLAHGNLHAIQAARSNHLQDWVLQSGLIEVKTQNYISQNVAPLEPAEFLFLKQILEFLSAEAQHLPLPAADMEIWRKLSEDDSPDHILRDPNFHYREGLVVVTGLVPEDQQST